MVKFPGFWALFKKNEIAIKEMIFKKIIVSTLVFNFSVEINYYV